MADYLKDEQYYSDLYDSFTVERCRSMEKSFLETEPEEYKGLSLKKRKKLAALCGEIAIYYVKGGRYAQKSQTVRDWMEKDRRKDEKLESVQAPSYIRCPNCHSVMNFESKDLYWGSDDPLRVLFLYRCQNCRKGKAVFENGEDFEPKPMLCPKCNSEVKTAYKKQPEKIDTIYTCSNPKCDYKEIDTLDLSKNDKEEVKDPDYEKDKKRFVMTDEEGGQYIQLESQMKFLNEHLKEKEEREKHKDVYDKVAKLKKLTIVELEKLLSKVLEKESYKKLELSNPDMGQFVIVNFTVRDSKDGRESNDSEYSLKSLFHRTLIDTNWRLMSEGVSYRLGILQGRLKAYDREEDLVKLVGGLKIEPGTKIKGEIS